MVFERLGPSLYDFLRRNGYKPFPLAMVRAAPALACRWHARPPALPAGRGEALAAADAAALLPHVLRSSTRVAVAAAPSIAGHS